jgi:hypothetical protein
VKATFAVTASKNLRSIYSLQGLREILPGYFSVKNPVAATPFPNPWELGNKQEAETHSSPRKTSPRYPCSTTD